MGFALTSHSCYTNSVMNRPLCIECKKNFARINYRSGGFMPRCDSCSRSPESRRKRMDKKIIEQAVRLRPWIVYKKESCEHCGFIPEHACQLDVDHIDGNKSNNDPSNLMTLCANCHRLKTYNAGEFREKRPKRTYEKNDPALEYFDPDRHRAKI